MKKLARGRPAGERHPSAVLTNREVELMRQCREAGMTWDALAAKFEVPKRTVRDICAYRRR